MPPRVLSVGVDSTLLRSRQALLTSRGYDCTTATPHDIDEALATGRFDLVILSVMLGDEQKNRIQAKLPSGTKVLSLQYLVWPDELFQEVGSALGSSESYRD
jgi:DNA-binding response OmpR family regulator